LDSEKIIQPGKINAIAFQIRFYGNTGCQGRCRLDGYLLAKDGPYNKLEGIKGGGESRHVTIHHTF